MKQEILNHFQIEQKTNRLAHQILENTFELDRFFLGGITGNGMVFANQLHEIIKKNSTQKVELFELTINKDFPLTEPIKVSIDEDNFENATIILVDDVLNSGKTMQYALMKLLEKNVRSIKTVALVDRKHRRYPIKADFVGLSLSTTLGAHVQVSLESGNYSAILS